MKAAIFTVNETDYALNGSAKMDGYPPIDPIWKENPNAPGRVNIGEVIKLALERCEKPNTKLPSPSSEIHAPSADSDEPSIDYQRCVVTAVKAFGYTYEQAAKECN